mmetsp:Transcript_75577/g.149376  ORF Transcript_75577/g.149376 Transcript_75577/m.149376 type:complete len:241 (+) Transcript_75577:221-943(+)
MVAILVDVEGALPVPHRTALVIEPRSLCPLATHMDHNVRICWVPPVVVFEPVRTDDADLHLAGLAVNQHRVRGLPALSNEQTGNVVHQGRDVVTREFFANQRQSIHALVLFHPIMKGCVAWGQDHRWPIPPCCMKHCGIHQPQLRELLMLRCLPFLSMLTRVADRDIHTISILIGERIGLAGSNGTIGSTKVTFAALRIEKDVRLRRWKLHMLCGSPCDRLNGHSAYILIVSLVVAGQEG